MTSRLRCIVAAAVFCAALASPAPALEVSVAGAFLDLPSGFTAGEGDGKTRLSYLAPDGGLELAVLVFGPPVLRLAGLGRQ